MKLDAEVGASAGALIKKELRERVCSFLLPFGSSSSSELGKKGQNVGVDRLEGAQSECACPCTWSACFTASLTVMLVVPVSVLQASIQLKLKCVETRGQLWWAKARQTTR